MKSVAWQLKSQLEAVTPVLPRLISRHTIKKKKANEICPSVFDRQQTLVTGNRVRYQLRGKPHRWSFTVRLYDTLYVHRIALLNVLVAPFSHSRR